MEPLRGVVQNYEWGMRSPDCQARPSLVAARRAWHHRSSRAVRRRWRSCCASRARCAAQLRVALRRVSRALMLALCGVVFAAGRVAWRGQHRRCGGGGAPLRRALAGHPPQRAGAAARRVAPRVRCGLPGADATPRLGRCSRGRRHPQGLARRSARRPPRRCRRGALGRRPPVSPQGTSEAVPLSPICLSVSADTRHRAFRCCPSPRRCRSRRTPTRCWPRSSSQSGPTSTRREAQTHASCFRA